MCFRFKNTIVFLPLLAAVAASCRETKHPQSALNEQLSASSTIESLLPEEKLATIKQALPRVAYPKLQAVFSDNHTLWYDHNVMARSYQDSYGAQTNKNWPNQIAGPAQGAASSLYDRNNRRWKFPFSTTAGTDKSTNITVANFMQLPQVNGRTLPIPVWQVPRNLNRMSWQWMYPNGTILGEVIFINHGNKVLPSEVRTRTRHSDGWASNVYRPFARAEQLIAAIKQRRPDWQQRTNLQQLVAHLESDATLTEKTLRAEDGFRGTFEQAGAIDVLPDFQDPDLVDELLTQTTFISTYGEVWKSNGSLETFAPSSQSQLSIVPVNYEAGIIEVTDESCIRCHQDAGRLASDFAPALSLYGELWGKDNIFTFHIFDETQFQFNRREGLGDTRRKNPRLVNMGILEDFDATKHGPPHYRSRD